MTRPAVVLDHLALVVHRWSDAYDRFVGTLGGTWARGGVAGDFAPAQLSFGHGMLLELVAPGTGAGFVDRFLERGGPGPHHITFMVASRDQVVDDLTRLGFASFRGRPDVPVWREAFVHPKETGIGTLVQLVETDKTKLEKSTGTGRPDDLPAAAADARPAALFGLTVASLPRARALLVDALQGAVIEKGTDWIVVTWGPGRSVLVRQGAVTPGGERLWDEAGVRGVGFVVFGPDDLTVADLEADPARLAGLPSQEVTNLPVRLW